MKKGWGSLFLCLQKAQTATSMHAIRKETIFPTIDALVVSALDTGQIYTKIILGFPDFLSCTLGSSPG